MRLMHFTIKSDEGLDIRGNLDLPRQPRALAIILHGFKGFKDWGFFPWLANYLCEQQFAVCRFNTSRSGIGDHPDSFDRLDLFADNTYTADLADLRAVVEHVQKRAPLPTFLLGHSRGGGEAILAASDVPNLRGVIAWSAIAHAGAWDEPTRRQWRKDGYLDVINSRTKQNMRMSTRMLDDVEAHGDRLDILAAASRLPVPLLAIHGGRDETVPVSETLEITASAPDIARVVIGTATHTFNAIHPLVHVPRELLLAANVSARFIGAYAT
jgi:uncharacterized protein